MHVLVIANGSKAKARKMLHQMKEWSISEHKLSYCTTSCAGDATYQVARATPLPDVIVSIGGDGTIHECVQGLLQIQPDLRPALLIVPCGTGNDYSRVMEGRTFHKDQFLSWLRQKDFALVDVLKIVSKNGGVVYSNNIADVGIGPLVVKNTNALWKVIPGKLRFLLGSLSALLRFKAYPFTLTIDGNCIHRSFVSIVLAKGKFFGGGLGIAPMAALNSGKIHITLIGPIRARDYLLHLPDLFKSKKITHPEISYTTAEEVIIEGEGTFEADGELYGSLPIRIEVVKKALRLVNPLLE
jgi:diacylglycerol kinase (ATP)